MHRFLLAVMVAAGLFLSTAAVYGQSAGGGISFFFPESLLQGSGSVSRESGFSTSLGLGDYLSLPAGFTYIKASGLLAYDDTDGDDRIERLDDRIWYVADTFLPYLRIKGSVDAGSFYFEGFGGVAGLWVVAPQAFDGAMGRYYGGSAKDDFYVFHTLKSEFSFGYGYQFGATAGMRFGDVRVGLEAVYTDVSARATASSDDYDYYEGATLTPSSDFKETFTARLRGISLGIVGSFAF